MVVIITGPSHTGKTVLAQKLLLRYHMPYISIDHLKMGLIRSGQTNLTPSDNDRLTEYLWPIVCEMIKTAIENRQNLIVEGCYVPYTWKADFPAEYLQQIRYICLVMSQKYIETHFDQIQAHACDAEQRLDDCTCTKQWLAAQNAEALRQCRANGCQVLMIDEEYCVEPELDVLCPQSAAGKQLFWQNA